MRNFDPKSFALGAAVAGATVVAIGRANGKLNATPGGLFLFGVGAGAFLTYTLERYGEREIDMDLIDPKLMPPADDGAPQRQGNPVHAPQRANIPFMAPHEQPMMPPPAGYGYPPYGYPPPPQEVVIDDSASYARRRPNPDNLYMAPPVEGLLNTMVQSGAAYFVDRVHNGVRNLVDQATGRNRTRVNPHKQRAELLEQRLRTAQSVLGRPIEPGAP